MSKNRKIIKVIVVKEKKIKRENKKEAYLYKALTRWRKNTTIIKSSLRRKAFGIIVNLLRLRIHQTETTFAGSIKGAQ